MSEIIEKIEQIIEILDDGMGEKEDYKQVADLKQQILSLLPDISMIEHVGKCKHDKLDLSDKIRNCPNCQGTGETTRPATLEDIDIIEIIELLYACKKMLLMGPVSAKSGGILRIKEGKE